MSRTSSSEPRSRPDQGFLQINDLDYRVTSANGVAKTIAATGTQEVTYPGPVSSYTITRNGLNVAVTGPGVSDALTGIEKLKFADVTIPIGQARRDVNGDGKSDILWQNTDGQADIWLMNGSSISSASDIGSNPGTSWQIKAAGDFDGDGKSDILWQNTNGQADVWLMNGLSIASASDVGGNPGTAWQIKGAGDFNGDGKSRHSVAEHEWPSRHLVDERPLDFVGIRRRRKSGNGLADQSHRRFQRRRQDRHPVAERERPGRHLAHERPLDFVGIRRRR